MSFEPCGPTPTTQPLCVVTSLSGGRSRLLVSRRSAQSGRYRVIGYLDRLAGSGFEFTYLATAIAEPGFVPLVGFADHSDAATTDRSSSRRSENGLSACGVLIAASIWLVWDWAPAPRH